MPFKIEKLPGLDTKVYTVMQAEPRAVPEGMPRVPFLGLMVASRGGGKTNLLINTVKKYDSTKTFDKLYVFSKTWMNEPKNQLLVDGGGADTPGLDGRLAPAGHRPAAPDHFYTLKAFTEFDDEIFKQVWQEIKGDIDAYKDYIKKKEAYERFLEYKGNIENFDQEALIDLYMNDFQPPVCPTRSGLMPQSLIIFDDMLGTPVYSNKPNAPLRNFTILHRHMLTSMLFLTQTFKAGLPKGLRNNLSLVILFTNKSEEIRKEVAREFSSFVNEASFLAMWDEATREPYGFLMVDFDAKDPKARFRKNFDTLLIPT